MGLPVEDTFHVSWMYGFELGIRISVWNQNQL